MQTVVERVAEEVHETIPQCAWSAKAPSWTAG